jgi:hypothetical protein
MSPSFHGRVTGRLAILLVLVVLLAGCSSAAAPSFDPSGPCSTDGKRAGAYPDLEALVPATFDGKAPQMLDSGRNCTAAQLTTLATHGVSELRFAGGVWPDGNSGVTMAVFTAPGLQSEWIAEWYEASARAGRTTGNIKVSKPTVAGRAGQRLDVVNNDIPQTVITWPSTRPDTINVVLASDEQEDRIQAALVAFR